MPDQTTLANLTGKASFRYLDPDKSLKENIEEIGVKNLDKIVRNLDVSSHKIVKKEEELAAADEAAWEVGINADLLEVITLMFK